MRNKDMRRGWNGRRVLGNMVENMLGKVSRRMLRVMSAVAVVAAVGAPQAFGQSADELLERGREAFMDYNFSEASRLYGQAKRKAKKTDNEFSERYNTYHRQLTDAENYLERVEKIVVIDSITVDRHDFFRNYRIPASSGTLRGAEALPGRRIEGVDYVFTNEGEDYKLWCEPDSLGNLRPVESMLLTDGKWSTPSPLWDDLSEDSDAIYPFMMADGVTLYYADNGENSIGGYDIMVATRDAADGTFLQPQNLGFPYNSPYDDYLLAIDELNGVGWWATDRNQLDDQLTLYVFIVNDLRKNYDPDEEDVTGYARIDDYIATQPEDADYDSLLAAIRAIDPKASSVKPEFYLPVSGGKTLHNYSEFKSAEARNAMKQYRASAAELDKALANLAELRRQYRDRRSSQLAKEISAAEQAADKLRDKTAKLRSDLYRALK